MYTYGMTLNYPRLLAPSAEPYPKEAKAKQSKNKQNKAKKKERKKSDGCKNYHKHPKRSLEALKVIMSMSGEKMVVSPGGLQTRA